MKKGADSTGKVKHIDERIACLTVQSTLEQVFGDKNLKGVSDDVAKFTFLLTVVRASKLAARKKTVGRITYIVLVQT